MRQRMSRKKLCGILLSVLSVIVGSAAIVGLLVGLNLTNWRKYDTLIHGSEVHGKVTLKDSHNHNAVLYSFILNGQTYTGIGQSGHGNPGFEQMSVGSD